jgi:hypothetical protein
LFFSFSAFLSAHHCFHAVFVLYACLKLFYIAWLEKVQKEISAGGWGGSNYRAHHNPPVSAAAKSTTTVV